MSYHFSKYVKDARWETCKYLGVIGPVPLIFFLHFILLAVQRVLSMSKPVPGLIPE